MEKTLRKITAFLLVLAEMVCFLPQLSMNVAADEAEKQEGYTVTLTGGANAVVSGGSTVQSGLLIEGMEAVYYTADTGYYFEDFEDITSNGITVMKLGEYLVEVYGLPEADVELVVPDAVRIPVTTTYTVTLTGGANAVTSGGDTVQSGLTDQMKAVYYTADTGYYFEDFEDITSNGITVTKVGDGAVLVFGSPEADVELVVPDAVRIPVTTTYTVTLTGGANAVTSGGDTVQSGLTDQMEAVYYTADTGYYFEDFEDITSNGITVMKLGEYLVEVYGLPEADVELVVPDAVRIPVTTTYTVTLTGGANAVTSGGDTVQSGLTGQMKAVYYTADTGYYFEDFEDITSNGITVTKVGDGAVLVFGIPEADVEIAVPDAVKIPVTYTVRFVVVNGAWNDESSDEIVVTLEGDDMKLTAEMIPSAGNMPDFAFVEGEWDVVPDEKTVITEDVTYTYTYAPHGPGWYEYDDNWFYFDEEGKLVENRWFRYKNKWYYVDIEGMMVTGWHEEGTRIYYLTDSGAMVTGWARVDDEWYYFDPSSGEMRKGGWFEINGKRYLFYDDGTMWSSAFYCEDDKTYYITEEGTFAKGWQKVDDYWYYFDPSTGVMKTDGWNKINGKWFYLGEDGIMFSGTFYDENDYTYYFTKDGYMATGWQKVDDYWYYFDPSTGVMKTDGWNKINGKWFYLGEDGIMFSGTFYDENEYTYYFTKDGSMATGWNKIDGEWYYFDPSSGAAKTGWFKDGEKWYYFDVVGVMTSGEFQYEGDKTYYLKDNGAMATRWAEIDGNWYWFGTDGVMACSTTVTINGKAYEFDSEGICLNP